MWKATLCSSGRKGYLTVISLSKNKRCHNKSLTAKLPALITDSLLLKTGGGFCGESNVPRSNNALHIWREQKQNEIASQTIQLTKERKYNGKLTKLSCRQQGNTVLFSTVLKPPSETLGSFSPRSKDVKTLAASENISRSVRTRTWMHNIDKSYALESQNLNRENRSDSGVETISLHRSFQLE